MRGNNSSRLLLVQVHSQKSNGKHWADCINSCLNVRSFKKSPSSSIYLRLAFTIPSIFTVPAQRFFCPALDGRRPIYVYTYISSSPVHGTWTHSYMCPQITTNIFRSNQVRETWTGARDRETARPREHFQITNRVQGEPLAARSELGILGISVSKRVRFSVQFV